MTNYI